MRLSLHVPTVLNRSTVPQVYSRAPITEAVIEVRVKTPLDAAQLDRLAARFARRYPAPLQKMFDINVEVGEVASKANQNLTGYRMSTSEGAKVLLLGWSSIATAKIAPYAGWEQLVEDAQNNWEIWLKIVGWQPLARIGVRYVNRLDIPTTTRIELTDYITVQPSLPRELDSGIVHFAMNLTIPLGAEGERLIINAGSVTSPIIGNQSLIVDIDVSRDTGLPEDDDGLWSYISSLRDVKNRVFEACITDKTRALFK
jgi:uncharacterized protein (TIGR04255 family)